MSAGRSHIVMIPGFGGFDALGQMEYYAGVTPLFRRWAEERHRPGVVLHYFDNFPTAGVSTRAGRLRSYLAKRIARGEIVPGEDALMLVGHSTGGLDIRRLLWELAEGVLGIGCWVLGTAGMAPDSTMAPGAGTQDPTPKTQHLTGSRSSPCA